MTSLPTLRRWIVAILWLGLLGSGIELLLLEHYEGSWQLVPLFLLALASIVLLWHRARRDSASIRALQGTMLMFVVAGVVGAGLHFRGAAEFQREVTPSLGEWELTKKVMRVKAPPVLAPGLMMQLGLIGLAYAHRHPDLAGPASSRLHME